MVWMVSAAVSTSHRVCALVTSCEHMWHRRPHSLSPFIGVLANGSCGGVSGITESWGLKLLCYLLCLQGSDTEEKESRSSVTSSPNDKQIDPALWLWQSKQG